MPGKVEYKSWTRGGSRDITARNKRVNKERQVRVRFSEGKKGGCPISFAFQSYERIRERSHTRYVPLRTPFDGYCVMRMTELSERFHSTSWNVVETRLFP